MKSFVRRSLFAVLLVQASAAHAACLSRTASGWENGCNFTVGVRWRDEGSCRACACTAAVGGNDTQAASFTGRVSFREIASASVPRARGDCRR